MTLKEDEAPITAAIFFESVNIPSCIQSAPMALLVKRYRCTERLAMRCSHFLTPVPGRSARLMTSIFTFLPSIHFNCMIRNGEINPFTSTTSGFIFPI